jgi:hypothetical protein
MLYIFSTGFVFWQSFTACNFYNITRGINIRKGDWCYIPSFLEKFKETSVKERALIRLLITKYRYVEL